MAPPVNVAVVDDDRLHLTMISDVLGAAGYRVAGYSTGEAALAALRKSPADLLVTDIMLPRMNGFELLRQLRKGEGTQRTPCVGVSALPWDTGDLKNAAGALSQFQLLRKPLDLKALIQLVAEMVAERKPKSPTARPVTGASPVPKTVTVVPVAMHSPQDILAEYSENLAHNGLFVRTQAPLPAQSLVELRVSLPFRDQPVVLSGTVIRSVAVEGEGGKPGMAVALERFPEALKGEFRAYVEGLRAGMLSHLGSVGPRLVLLVGMRRRLPPQTAQLLSRSEFSAYWVDDLATAELVAKQNPPHLLLVDGELFKSDPRGRLARLSAAGQTPIWVCASPALQAQLGAGVETLDAQLPGDKLLQSVAKRLEVRSRVHQRVDCLAPVQVRRLDGFISGMMENLSLGGLSLLTDAPCSVGEELKLQFELPRMPGAVRGTVKIVRATPLTTASGERVRLGAKFIDIDPQLQTSVHRFLTSVLKVPAAAPRIEPAHRKEPVTKAEAAPVRKKHNPFGL